MTFSTSTDQTVRRKTKGIFVLFTVLPLFYLVNGSPKWLWFAAAYFLLMQFILFYTYLHKPQQYHVDGRKIVIKRRIGNVQIKTNDIARVDRIHHNLLQSSSKGGAFGYFGKFNTDLGLIHFYATRPDNFVLLTKMDNTKIILTPDQQNDFIKEVEKTANLPVRCC